MSDWRERAACAEVDSELFFPAVGGGAPVRVQMARSVCLRCEVRAECLAEGLADDLRASQYGGHGIWGGMTPKERERLRKGVG